jgi:acyl-CoA synthetase (AMP-forming)/AMP-acid ligase II
MLTHDNLFWASIGLTHTIDWSYRYRFLSVAPLFHIGGLAPIFGNIHAGCTTVFMPNFDPIKIWDVIVAEKINFMMTVPAMLQFMLFAPDIAKKNLSSVKHFVCGGSAVPQSLIMAYDNLGIKIDQVYGITEYAGAVTFWTADMGMDKSHSMGKSVFHGQVKIFRPESDEELPVGDVGEIGCYGPQVFKGYWNNPEATAAVLKNGYYRSGDMGKVDEKGFLYVVDRLKDMIISGSENIYPAELEQVIMGHPDVAEVAVVGKPDAKWGEIPVAMIVVKPGADVKAEDIIALCRKNLAGYKCVKEVRFIGAIPKNAVGKVLKKELRTQLV